MKSNLIVQKNNTWAKYQNWASYVVFPVYTFGGNQVSDISLHRNWAACVKEATVSFERVCPDKCIGVIMINMSDDMHYKPFTI